MQGERLGPYLIDRELGSGGMGTVYAATLSRTAAGQAAGATVALKVVHPRLLATEGFFKRFMREAQLGQSIAHENVVRTLDCDAIAGSHFLVMEYVDGQTLKALQRELETVPEELCRHVGREICKGLAAIHDAGVVHRDMKPENVIIARCGAARVDDVAERTEGPAVGRDAAREANVRSADDYIVKIMDLGVARLIDEALRLSQSGAFVGSVEYAAPEQFDGGDVDARCDLHALGLLLYELSCGQHPYRGDTFHVVMKRVREDVPRPLGEINPQLSAFFEQVVHTLLAKDREERFGSAAELLGVLEDGEDSAWWHARAATLQAETQRPIRRIRIPRETAVYGRQKELAHLRAAYDAAATGDARVVVIEGEAGIGKSRVVDELIRRLEADGEDVNFLFGSYPPGGASSAAGAFSTAFREHFGEAGPAAYLPQTPLLVPAFEAVLRGDVAPDDALALTKDSLATCFIQAARALAAERPTILLIDDLHFAPDDARALFSALAMALPGHRVLLIGTTRPGVEGDWRGNLQRFEHVSQIEVQRLVPKDLAQLLSDSFQSEALAAALGHQIAVKSDGNPFFAFEIIRGLREGQFITQKDDGTWVSTRVIDEIQIPSSVLDLVNARVADLTEDERNILDVAACWGFEWDPLLVGAVLDMKQIPLMRTLAHVEKKHRLVRSAGRRFVFDHHQVQEALYTAMPELLREPYHAALAEALETRTRATDRDPGSLDGALCVDLCDHYLKGGRGESALRYLHAAQTHLTSGYLHAEMAALTERALAVPDLLTRAERANTLLRLATAVGLLGRRPRQEECARAAAGLAESADDDRLRGEAATLLGDVLSRTSRLTEAESVYRRAREIAVRRGDQTAQADATLGLGNVSQALGRLPEAQEHFEHCLALSGAVGHRRGVAAATGNLAGVFLALGRLPEAQEWYAQSLALSRELGSRTGEANATGGLGVVSKAEGRLPAAQEQFERSLALCREAGFRIGEAHATGNLGAVFQSQGRLRKAQAYYERHLALSRETGFREGEAIALHNLGSALWEAGEGVRGQEHLLACLDVSGEIAHRHLAAATHLALGSLRAAAADAQGARASLAAARDLAAEIGVASFDTLARCELACLPGGDAADALAAFAEHEERLSAEERLDARHLLWRATGDRAHLEEAKRLLDESVANVDAETRASMLTSLRVNGEVMAAWRAEFGDDEGAGPNEFQTRVAP